MHEITKNNLINATIGETQNQSKQFNFTDEL
jgi:hypothetical protein